MVTTETDDDTTGDSLFDGMKDRSLKTAGYAYLVGDAALFASGAMAGRYKEASSGLLWGLGGLAAARYGNPNAEQQLKILSQRLGQYLRKEGVDIPKTPDTQLLAQEGGVIDHIESFLYKYPSQMLNAVYGLGALQLSLSGMQHKKRWDTASGALIVAGALAGLLMPEKESDPEHPPEGIVGKTMAWLQEKPLRISGAFYALNNATLTVSAFKEMRTNPAQKSYLFKFLTVGSYIFGNTMLALSSKGHAGGNIDHKIEAMENLADTSARVIAAQAPQVQEALLEQIAGFLAAQPETHFKSPEIAQMLHAKLAEVGKSTPGWQQRLEDKNNVPLTPSL